MNALLEQALLGLQREGAAGEVYVESSSRVRVAVREGQVERIERHEGLGLAVRVFERGGVGFAFTTETHPEAVRRTIADARRIAVHVEPDDARRLVEAEEPPPLPFPNESADPLEAEACVRAAQVAEAAARALDPRIGPAREAGCQHAEVRVALANSRGLRVGYRVSRAAVWLDTLATESGRSQYGFYAAHALAPAALAAEEVGREAARRALAKLGAEPARTGRYRTVLLRETVGGLLEALAPAFSARRVLHGRSLLAGRLGERVAGTEVSLADDPRLPGGDASVPVDGEGVPTRRVELVSEGRLRAYLHDSFTAQKLRGARPGNALRAGYMRPPEIGTTNLVLVPGTLAFEALLELAGEGLLVTELMGLHTVDPVSGDFSLGACGQRIRAGRLAGAVDRMALSGNLLQLLQAIEAVGADLRAFPGGGAAPSLVLKHLDVAGT